MVPPPDDDDRPEERALSPEELDISSEERVAELDDGQYVIGTDGPPKPKEENEGAAGSREGRRLDTELEDLGVSQDAASGAGTSVFGDATGSSELTGAEVKQWIAEELDRTDSQYAYRISAKTGDTIRHQQLASDDIGTAFDGLLMWYARQVAGSTPIEQALGILLAESTITVRYPIAGLLAYLDSNDLEPDDSIADLLSTIRKSDGLIFPLRDQR